MTDQSKKLESVEETAELFKLYLKRTEGFISESIDKLESIVNKHEDGEWAHVSIYDAVTKNIDPPEEAVNAYREHESVEIFPILLRTSFFVMVYGYLEAFLMSECEVKKEKIPKNSKMESAKDILIKHGSLSIYLFDDSDEWKKIKKYNKLRNCLVHDDGFLNAKDDVLGGFVEKTETLFLIDQQIAIKKGFCEEVVMTIEKFLIELVSVGYK